MHPTDKAARVAGAVYLSLVLTGPFSLLYVPGKLIVRGNATATAANILGHEMLFRFGIVANLIGSVLFMFVGMALYRLFSGVNKTQALNMLVLVLVSTAVGFMDELNNIAALILFRGADFLGVVEKTQREALGMLFVRLHGQGIVINEIFWGLWLIPFGVLVIQSRLLRCPRSSVNCGSCCGFSLRAPRCSQSLLHLPIHESDCLSPVRSARRSRVSRDRETDAG